MQKIESVESVKPMTTEMLQALREIELNWHDMGEFLAPVGFNLEEALNNSSFKKALLNRGITPPSSGVVATVEPAPRSLSQQQTAAVLTIVNFNDKRTRNAKLRDLGISVSTWNGWLKNPTFNKFYMKMAEKQFGDALPIAQEALVKAMDNGKVEAIKFYLELMGKGPGSAESSGQNVRMVLQKLVEVLQLHIPDPELLNAIGMDFDRVLKGEAPVGPQRVLAQRVI